MSASLKAKLIAGFIIAFLAGAAAGAFFTFHNARHWRSAYGHHPHSVTEHLRDRISSELHLTPQQLTKIQPILERAGRQLQEIRAETGAKVRQVMTETDRALKPELTDAQRERLETIQQNLRERKGARRGAEPDEGDGEKTPQPAPVSPGP
jgi:hypothetical protein